MEMFIGIAIDLLFLLFMIFIIVRTAKKGFALSFFNILAFVGAFMLASFASKNLPDLIYNVFFRQAVTERISSAIADSSVSAGATVKDFLTANFPFVYKFAKLIGIVFNEDTALSTFSGNLANSLSDNIIAPIFTNLISMFVYIVSLAISLPILRFIAKKISAVFTISVVGAINTVLGAILGIPKSVILAFLVAIPIVVFSSLVLSESSVVLSGIQNSFVIKFVNSLII